MFHRVPSHTVGSVRVDLGQHFRHDVAELRAGGLAGEQLCVVPIDTTPNVELSSQVDLATSNRWSLSCSEPAYDREFVNFPFLRLSADDKFEHIVYGYNVTCRHISALSLPRCFVTNGVLACSAADLQGVHLEEVSEGKTVDVPSAARMFHKIFVTFSVSDLAVKITSYVEQCA